MQDNIFNDVATNYINFLLCTTDLEKFLKKTLINKLQIDQL